jgi:56kDa selenium binding protein (SBP56)
MSSHVLLTSSFTGWNNHMMGLGKLIKDAEAMKLFGNTMVLWNLKSMQPEKIFSVPGAPLEIRWSLKEGDDWAITFSALTSKLWLVNHDANNEWQAKEVATIGDPAKIPMPVDASISADAKTLWVNTFMDGTTHLFDISDPTKPVQIYEKVTGKCLSLNFCVAPSADMAAERHASSASSSSVLARLSLKFLRLPQRFPRRHPVSPCTRYNHPGQHGCTKQQDFGLQCHKIGEGRAGADASKAPPHAKQRGAPDKG